MNRLNFEYNQSAFSVVRNAVKKALFRRLTKNGTELFLRGQDMISTSPQTTGMHEPHVTTLIHHLSTIGYSDFLFDIGANIGLSSCQNGNSFEQVHMFEPNPYCCNILEVNSVIALNNTEYYVHKFGLGDQDKNTVLTVPKGNWGGAFINDESNTYDQDILAQKDQFEKISDENYVSVDISIRKTESVLSELFQKLAATNLTSGVIKIDVEGYEAAVLRGLAESLPEEFKVMVVFESWDPDFDMDGIVKLFKDRAVAYTFNYQTSAEPQRPGLLGRMFTRLNLRRTYALVENNTKDWSGDLVLAVN